MRMCKVVLTVIVDIKEIELIIKDLGYIYLFYF